MRNFFRAAAFAAALATAGLAGPFSFKPSVSVSVTTSATSLAGSSRHTYVQACNQDSSKTVFWSFDATVTTSTGQPLQPGACVQFQKLAQGQLLWGIVSSGTADVRILEGFEQ